MLLLGLSGSYIIKHWSGSLQKIHIQHVCEELVQNARVARQWAMLQSHNMFMWVDQHRADHMQYRISIQDGLSKKILKDTTIISPNIRIRWRGGLHSPCLQFAALSHSGGRHGSYYVENQSYGYQCRVIIAPSGRVRIQKMA